MPRRIPQLDLLRVTPSLLTYRMLIVGNRNLIPIGDDRERLLARNAVVNQWTGDSKRRDTVCRATYKAARPPPQMARRQLH